MDATEDQVRVLSGPISEVKCIMFKHRMTETVSLKTTMDWFLLSFLAGAVNAGGYIACHRFVSHVTGFATIAGLDFARGEWSEAIGMLTVPVYFLFGVMISAYLIDRRAQEGKRSRYALVMGMVTFCLVLASLGGWLGYFGVFGSEVELRDDYILLSLLCMASGLQNAALTSASGATIRTTHLTGLTTDLGIGLIRSVSLPSEHPQRAAENKANWLRIGTILSFMSGGAVGALLFLSVEYLGFLLPAAIAAYATAVAISDAKATLR